MSEKVIGYLKQLEKMLFGIPQNIPSHYHRYVIVSNLIFVFALVGHSIFIPIYWILGAPLPFLINLLFVPMDALCLFLNQRRCYKSAFGIWVAVVIFHTMMSTLAYGWDSGFHYYILSLTVFIFIAPWKKSINIILICAITGIYIWLNSHGAGLPPAISLPFRLGTAIRIINMVVNFTILSYLAYYYALATEKTQKTLEEREKTLKTILAASPVGIALVKFRTVNWANDTLLQMMGYESSQVKGRDILRFYPNVDDLDRLEQLAHEIGQQSIDIPDTQLARKDGSTFPCHIKIRPLAPKDKTKGSIVVVMDITAQKAAEQEKEALLKKFQRAEKMEAVGTMAGGVAHDLNNILSGILSYPEVLLMKIPATDPMKKPLEVIKRCGEKAAAIVQDLLTLTRRGVHIKQGINLNAAVSDYLGSPEHDSLKANHPLVRFETALCADTPYIIGSPIHLSKTLMNLMSNACEAMTKGGVARIATEKRYLEKAYAGYELIEPGTYTVLSLSDSGHGISRENLERIFEPFYTKKVMGRSGTGLGLAVVWGTVKDSGGFIDVISGTGQGTRFDLYFPAAMEPELSVARPLSHDDYRGAGEHVLVVDDMEEQRVVAAGMLEELGYKVETVVNGEAAVAWVRENHTDLLLLDMIMEPGIDGLETYRQILELRPGQAAVIASGYSETDRVTRALSLGRARYLKKPYSLLALARTIKMALRR